MPRITDSSSQDASVKELPLFEYKYRKDGCNIYGLNVAMLNKNECHMFFPIPPCEELLIATAIEFMAFHPLNKKLNAKFNINLVKCGGIELFWCRFPRDFQDACGRVAQVFNMKMKMIARDIVTGGGGGDCTSIEFPMQNNILSFQGPRSFNFDKIHRECESIVRLGNDLEKLDID